MKKLKKTLSLILAVCLSLVFVLSTMISSGITVSSARSSSTYKSELWLLCGHEYGMSRGTVFDISESSAASPYDYETGTAYIPVSAPAYYTGTTVTREGDTVSVRHQNGDTSVLTVGSTAWSGGEFLLPVVAEGDDVYISILSVNDVFGLQSIYNRDIGCIIFYVGSTSSSGLTTQIDTLGNLLFERPTASQIYSDLLATVGSADTHPRLLASDERFEYLRSVYANPTSDRDSFFYKLNDYMAECLGSFNALFYLDSETGKVDWKSEGTRLSVRQPYYIYDENGNRLVGRTSYTYTDENGNEVTLTPGGSGRGDGYDYGGRSNVDHHTKRLPMYAFAWQITGEEKYVEAFYLLATEVGKWEHWGEGHFLNCADGSVWYALGLDWIYHAFDDEPEKRDEMAAILYEKGLMKGYYAIVCDSLYKQGASPRIDLSASSASRQYQYGTHPSLSGQQTKYLSISYTAGSSGWRTINRTNNWQTVCGSGMTVAALYLSEYEEYRDNATFVAEQYLLSLERCLGQYAPDGAYVESPGYWGYGTNTLMITLAALDSSLGTTYGYEDIVGLYDSFYYTIGISDGEYVAWNYHDSGSGRIDYQSFYLASKLYADPTLAYLRNDMFQKKYVRSTLMDLLYYEEGLADGATPESIPLDFNFKGIDTATFRSDFTEYATYTGLHVGPNNVTHGDYDCGNFTLTMGGVKWVVDPTPEDYNVKGFWNSAENGTRYHLYSKSIEGHSTVMIRNDPSLPLGQKYTMYSTAGYAVIDEFYSDANGGYAISDMTTEYGDGCISGKRGVLLTNSRTTVVLQDEISFSEPTDLTWLLNLQYGITISEDGRSAVVRGPDMNNKQVDMRVTLISDNPDLKFRKMTNAVNSITGKIETVFPGTYTKTNNNDERAKDPVQRLAIEANGVTDFNVAVVFQILAHEDEIVPYTYTAMDSWVTDTDEWVKEANKDIDYDGSEIIPMTPYKKLYTANERLAAAYGSGDIALVGSILRETAALLRNYDQNNPSVSAEAARYRGYRRQYNLLLRAANESLKDQIFD